LVTVRKEAVNPPAVTPEGLDNISTPKTERPKGI
jgi:hypothetical protein